MNREDFGKLLQILRRENHDENDKPWTQESLAERIKRSKRTIEQLEKGVLKKLDADLLEKIANAFNLTTMERKEFFFSATGVDDKSTASARNNHDNTLTTLLDTLESIELPIFVNDVYGDIIAANRLIINLLKIPDSLITNDQNIPEAYNIMGIVFSDHSNFHQLAGNRWDQIARHNMQFFREISLRYRHTPYFDHVLSSLKNHPRFRGYWNKSRFDKYERSIDNVHYDYNHPDHGQLRYLANISATFTGKGELYTVMYIPLTPETRKVFTELALKTGCGIERFAPWPDKNGS